MELKYNIYINKTRIKLHIDLYIYRYIVFIIHVNVNLFWLETYKIFIKRRIVE